MRKIFFLIVLAGLLPLGSATAEAFVFEEAAAIKFTEQTALFSISYSARFREYVTYHPIRIDTQARGRFNTDTTLVEVFGSENATVVGFVESSAEVRNRKYRVRMNDDEILTVHALVTVPTDEKIADVRVGLKAIPVNAVAPNTSSKYFTLTGVVVERAMTEAPQ